MFPDDEDVKAVRDAMFDPVRVPDGAPTDGLLKTEFQHAARQGRATTCPATRACRRSG